MRVLYLWLYILVVLDELVLEGILILLQGPLVRFYYILILVHVQVVQSLLLNLLLLQHRLFLLLLDCHYSIHWVVYIFLSIESSLRDAFVSILRQKISVILFHGIQVIQVLILKGPLNRLIL
jgi:hypothetical protein